MGKRLSSLFIITSFVFSISVQASYPIKPDPKRTPGALCTLDDPDFEGFRYEEKIIWCDRNVSGYLKDQIYDEYGIPEECRRRYTIDHFIPLSIGGDNSAENLWPEHKRVKETRPQLEQFVHDSMRKGTMTQKEAIELIVLEKMNPPEEDLDPDNSGCN
jgi:hypothetical protein